MVFAISRLKLYQDSESRLQEKEKKNCLSYCSYVKFQENSLMILSESCAHFLVQLLGS